MGDVIDLTDIKRVIRNVMDNFKPVNYMKSLNSLKNNSLLKLI